MYGHTPPFTQSISRTGWCEPGADVCHVHNVYVGPGLIPAVQARLVSPQTSLQPRPHLTGVCSASARCWAPSADSAHGQTMITQSLTSLRLMLGVETQRCSSPRIITPGLARRGHLAGVAYAQSPEPSLSPAPGLRCPTPAPAAVNLMSRCCSVVTCSQSTCPHHHRTHTHTRTYTSGQSFKACCFSDFLLNHLV